MKTVLKLLQIPAMTLLLVFTIYSSSFAALAASDLEVEIYEQWNEEKGEIKFAVENTSFNDIIGFAVGNDYGFSFTLEVDNINLSDWTGVELIKTDNGWETMGKLKSTSSTGLLDSFNFSGFAAYDSIFVFYGKTALPVDFTGGFRGYANMNPGPGPNSVIFRSNGEIIPGDTITEPSSVPIPGAAILLLSGLAGLVRLKRRN